MDTPVKIYLLGSGGRGTVEEALRVVDLLERYGYTVGKLFVAV